MIDLSTQAQIVHTKVFRDSRGHFRETLNVTKSPWTQERFIQQNVSVNHAGVFRGLHYQLSHPQGKLVTVLSGSVRDFVLDLRLKSPTYRQVKNFLLTHTDPENATLWVPPGYAHGFYALEDHTVFSYNVFGHGWTQGDEYSIDPYSVPEVAEFLRDLPVLMSDKDRDSLHVNQAPTY